MTDFIAALDEGLDAAIKAEIAKKEIDSVFDEMKTAILSRTNNKVRIERKAFLGKISLDDEDDPLSRFAAAVGVTAAVAPYLSLPNRTWMIVAYNPEIGSLKEMRLSYWEMDPAGYPCKLRWRTETQICEDKEALSQGLADLLRDPVVGKKIYTLTKLEPPKKDQSQMDKKDDG